MNVARVKWFRVMLNIALLVALVWFPWWVAVFMVLLLVFQFRAYEVLAWGVLADALYAAPLTVLADLPIFFTALFAVLFLSAEYSKRFLIFYS